MELVKATIPSNDQSPPREIFEIMKAALLAHFREQDAKPSPNQPASSRQEARGLDTTSSPARRHFLRDPLAE
jgi:hypothetical protein